MRVAPFVAFFALSLAQTLFAASAEWINNTANTPDTAYDWDEPSNWKDGYVGGTDPSDYVTIAPTAKVYIKVPDGGVQINRLLGGDAGNKAVLIGDGTIYLRSTSAGGQPQLSTLAYLFCDFEVPSGETSMPHIYRANFCGNVSNGYSGYMVGASSSVNFHFDMYANAAGASRSGDLANINQFGIGSTPLTFYAPVGADAVSGTWRLKSGSSYAYRVSSTAHALAVGTTVTAPSGYLPGGTFLKRVFDNATIELSSPAGADGEVTLSFAAFTPDFLAAFPARFTQHGSSMTIKVSKTRPQDVARVEIGDYFVRSAAKNCTVVIGYDSAQEVGTLVFKSVSGTGTYKYFDVRNAHIELAGAGDTGVTEFSADLPWTMSLSQTGRVTVPNDVTGIVNVLTNFNGTLVKDGGGLFKVGLGDASSAGTLSAKGGTLQVMRNATVPQGATLFVNSISVSAGATLVMPEGGITVNTLELESGAAISGNTELVVLDPASLKKGALGGVSFLGGAKIRFATGDDESQMQFSVPEARVVGHPAFWVDASKPESIVYFTENGTNFVTRWNDWRDGEPMFCTNVASVYPLYVSGGTMAKTYVRLPRNGSATKIEDTPQLVWSVPISGIKAVFLVQDPTDGGGEILGRTSARCPKALYGSQGGPYYRSAGSYVNPLVASAYSTPCVVNGRFYIDGKEVVGTTTGYSAKYSMQLVEHHVNTNYDAHTVSPIQHDLVCDAFGTGYEQPSGDLAYKFGMRIAEYIIYTNSLTYAERLQTAQYLMKKWCKRNVFYTVADTNEMAVVSGADTILDVADGKAQALNRVMSGSICKNGEGLLYVDGLFADALDVREGEVRVASGARETEVPGDAWLHMDADDDSTITKASGTDKLSIWSDLTGSGRTLRPTRSASANVVYVEENAINGRTAIDLGEFAPRSNAVSDGLIMYREDGSLDTTDVNGGLEATYTPQTVQTMFFVYDSSAGGGPLFGGCGSDWPGKGLPHHYEASGNDTPIFYANNYFANNKYDIGTLSNELANGNAVFRRNGEQFNPFERKFLKGVERVTFQYNTGYRQGRRGDTFGTYGNGYSAGDYCGGLKYGEIILYPRMLSSDEVARVEAYLARKWSGIETPGYGAAKADALSVASGATLKVLGLPFETAVLSGAGTIDGDVKVTTGGAVVVDVANDGTVGGGLVVTGDADFSAAGEIALVGSPERISAGKHLLLYADSVTPASSWTVTGGRAGLVYAVSVEDGSLYLTVKKTGLQIIVE